MLHLQLSVCSCLTMYCGIVIVLVSATPGPPVCYSLLQRSLELWAWRWQYRCSNGMLAKCLTTLGATLHCTIQSASHTQAVFPRSCSYMLAVLQHNHALIWTSHEHASWLWSVNWVIQRKILLQQMRCDKQETVSLAGQHAAKFWHAANFWAPTTCMVRAPALLIMASPISRLSNTCRTVLLIFQPLVVLTTLSEWVQVKLLIIRSASHNSCLMSKVD